jgi:hypothetical protein
MAYPTPESTSDDLALRTPVSQVHSTRCLNCGQALTGPFCSGCGQRDVPPYPSVRELAVDAFWELSGWDGRFATTVRALVALFYHGRKYPEHLYFAIHLHAFVFLALALAALAKFTRVPVVVGVVASVATFSIPIYATIAFRRNYAGSLVGTLSKGVAIAAIYLVICAAAFATTIYVVSVMG